MPPSSLPALSALPTITSGSPAHATLIEQACNAYETEHHAERGRMLLHLLRNTLPHHCDPQDRNQMKELGAMIVDIKTAQYGTFADFARLRLAPFVKRHKPTPPKRKPMSREEFVLRRLEEDEARAAYLKQLAGARRQQLRGLGSLNASAN